MLVVVAGVTLGVKFIINIGQMEFFPSEVDKILKEKNRKGYLSIGNLNPHIHPKDLVMTLHSKLFSSRVSEEDTGNKKDSRKDRDKSKTSDKITTEIELNPRAKAVFQE